jgi:proteasome lid subunit RPN8/RPN11
MAMPSAISTIVLLTQAHSQAIFLHAEQCYPEECCGLLLGNHQSIDGVEVNIVRAVYSTANVWEQSLSALDRSDDAVATAQRRYRIDSVAMLQAQQHARANHWDVIGIYHSHPNAAAVPSEWDRAWAWTQYSYLIVSLQNGVAQDLKSWSLDADREFLAETLIISDVMTGQGLAGLSLHDLERGAAPRASAPDG